jgi:outer membrane protein TolC
MFRTKTPAHEYLYPLSRVLDVIHLHMSRSWPLRRTIKTAAVILTLLLLLSAITSCKTNLGQLRQDNASIVLTKYRARSLAEANNGKTDLTVHDCVRLALANSLDLQSAIWDEHVRGKLAQSSSLRSLPTIRGFYNQTQRDLLPWSRSDVINKEGLWEVSNPDNQGDGVTNFSTGRERLARFWNAQLAWSPMDAAMARFLAEVKGNEALQSSYQRARVAQQLVGTVTAAFYRLMALNHALSKAQALESNRQGIERDLNSLVQTGLVESQENLTAKTLTAEARNQVADIRLNIDRQRELIAAAMNICPDSLFTVIGSLTPLPQGELDPCKLEATALMNRPEAYQADLTFISSMADHKRLMVKYFPRVEGFFGYFRDENHFLLNKNWVDGGVTVSWDLLDFTTNLLERDAAKNKISKTDRERAAISMGILSQVKLKTLETLKSLEKFRKTSDILSQAHEALRIATDIEQVKDKRAGQKLMRISRQKSLCNSLQVEIDRLLALGECHSAFAELDTAVGTNYPVRLAQNAGYMENTPPVNSGISTVGQRARNFLGRLRPF